MTNRGQLFLGKFLGLIMGAVALVVLAVTILFSVQIAGSFFSTMAVDGPAGTGNDTVQVGAAFTLMALSAISIPLALFISLTMGGDPEPRRPP